MKRIGSLVLGAALAVSTAAWSQPANVTTPPPPNSATPANVTIPPNPQGPGVDQTGARRLPLLTLGQAALQALRAHPDLRVAAAQIEAAQAQIEQATAGWYPRVTGQTRSTFAENQSAAVGGQQVVRSGGIRNYQAGFSAAQTLLDFGQTRHSVSQATHTAEAVEWDTQGVLQDLLLRVSESYFSTLREAQSVIIQTDNVRNAELQLARARGFYEAGTRARIEVTRALADLANANLALIQARNALARARAGLFVNMGVGREEPAELSEVVVVPPPWEQEEAVNVSTENRPELQAQLARLSAARSNVQQARAQYFPTIAATYNYNWSDQLFPPALYSWNAGLSMTVPVFNEPVLGAQVRRAEADQSQAEARLGSLTLTARQAVVEAWLNLREAQERLRTAQFGLAAAEENYRLASERYQVGVGASLDVSDAQRLLVQARSQEVQARYDVQLASLRLYRATGKLTLEGLLASRPGPPPTPPALPPPLSPDVLRTSPRPAIPDVTLPPVIPPPPPFSTPPTTLPPPPTLPPLPPRTTPPTPPLPPVTPFP